RPYKVPLKYSTKRREAKPPYVHKWPQYSDASKKRFVAALKKYAVSRSMTPESLAALVGCSLRTWKNWEAGRRLPGNARVFNTVRALGFNEDAIVQAPVKPPKLLYP